MADNVAFGQSAIVPAPPGRRSGINDITFYCNPNANRGIEVQV